MSFRQFKPFEASSVFEFRDPDTGFVQRASKLTELYKNIIQYRAQNNLEMLENLNLVVENYLCGLPENCNKCNGVELHRSLFTYVKGGIQLLKNMFFRVQVTQEVAEERAAQCVQCKFNVFPDRGPFMAFADEIAISQVGDKHVSVERELGSCEVCSCVLRSKVFLGGTLPKATDDEMKKFKEVDCWQISMMKE